MPFSLSEKRTEKRLVVREIQISRTKRKLTSWQYVKRLVLLLLLCLILGLELALERKYPLPLMQEIVREVITS